MQPACAKPGCCHNGVVTIPIGHGRTASRVYLCEPHFEAWLSSLRVRKRWPCAIDGCVDMEHLDGLCERHWVTLRGADPPGTPAVSTSLHLFTVRHRRPTMALVADAPDVEEVEAAMGQTPTVDRVARLASKLARSVVREVGDDVAEAARLLRESAERVRLLGTVTPARTARTPTPPARPDVAHPTGARDQAGTTAGPTPGATSSTTSSTTPKRRRGRAAPPTPPRATQASLFTTFNPAGLDAPAKVSR